MKIQNQTASIRQCATKTVVEAGWAPTIVIALHILLSRGFNAYAAIPGVDLPMHFLGGVAMAFFFHRASINGSKRGLLGPFHPTTHVLLVFFATCSATVFWEFAEFVNDRYFDGHTQVGLTDTMVDMSIGICGGITLLSAVKRRVARLDSHPVEGESA